MKIVESAHERDRNAKNGFVGLKRRCTVCQCLFVVDSADDITKVNFGILNLPWTADCECPSCKTALRIDLFGTNAGPVRADTDAV
jgi:hypothetical protein